MAKPEYKLSTPNTGSYQLAPQAAPVSTYVRPKQLDPNLTDYKTQAATFQNFVESMTEWRVAENKDNQEKAQLRALADNALGELDANLEGEDDDYREFGMYLQGKNYAQEVGSKLVTEITVGSEGQMGIMDRAFAEAKLPKNHNRKVADIFSEMLEERKDYYRDQVPDSSDTYYSGFGEGLQPYVTEINKAFYEKVQKETYSDRRENFAQGFLDQAKKDIRLVKDGAEKIVFNQAYLREFAADNGIAAGLSEDAALGEAIRIWSQELREVIDGAESEEDLEIANDMLAVFYTDIKSKDGVKGRARLISIPIFEKEAGRLYVALGNAKDAQKKLIEADVEKEKNNKRSNQEISVISSLVSGGKLPKDLVSFKKTYPELKSEDFYQLIALENSIKNRNNNTDYERKDFGNALVKAKQGALSYNDALNLFIGTDKGDDKGPKISESNFLTLTTAINQSKKYDSRSFQLFENSIVQNLNKTPPGLDLKTLERAKPQAFSTIQNNLLELQITIIDEAEQLLEENQEPLDFSQQQEMLSKVRERPRVIQAVKNYNDYITSTFGDTKSTTTPDGDKEEIKPLTIKLPQNSSIDVSAEKQNRYFTKKGSGWNLYNDYYDFTLSLRGSRMALDKEDNIFASLEGSNEEKRKAGKKLFIELQKRLPEENWPLDENGNPMKWGAWITGAMQDDLHSQALDKTLKEAIFILKKDLGLDEAPINIPERKPSVLEQLQKYHRNQP